MKFNKNPFRAARKLMRDIRSLKQVTTNFPRKKPESWDSNKKNVLIMVTSLAKGGAQRVRSPIAEMTGFCHLYWVRSAALGLDLVFWCPV